MLVKFYDCKEFRYKWLKAVYNHGNIHFKNIKKDFQTRKPQRGGVNKYMTKSYFL